MSKECVLNEKKICNNCNECLYCDLDATKICNNCCKCIENNLPKKDYETILIDDIILENED